MAAIVIACIGCEEYPDAYEVAGGKPEVLYVRMPNIASVDSLLDGAFLGNTVCIVGNNLRSVYELFFNDQKAILNTSMITDNTLIVTVPGNIPETVTDNIYLVTKGGESVAFPFKSRVPKPLVSAALCEYVNDGDEAVLLGDFFIDDPNIPLKITMAGNIPVTEILSIKKTEIRFIVPDGTQKGFINVESLYGTGRSHFQFRDDRGIILDFDGLNPKGWRAGRMKSDDGITGRYGFFKGNMADGDWFDGGDAEGFELDVWKRDPQGSFKDGDWFDATAMDKLLLKFEVNVVEPWSSSAMSFIWTPWTTEGNGHFGGGSNRNLWIPWATTGSFKTDGWMTVSIPMTDCKYDSDGKVVDIAGPGNYGGLTIFVWKGGIPGTPCTTEIRIDNVRVVPME
jgi:hypothetical protein